MARTVAFRGAILSPVSPASFLVPGLFHSRGVTCWGVSLGSTWKWPSLNVIYSTSRSSRCEEDNAESHEVPRGPCTLEEQTARQVGSQSLKRYCAIGDSQEDNGDIVNRRKSRALGLNTTAKGADAQGTTILNGRDSSPVASKEGELNEMNGRVAAKRRWFPHINAFQLMEGTTVSCEAILAMLDPLLSEDRKQRIGRVVENRTISVCLVVEGLSDLGNISAICRTADAMGFQSIHVISNIPNLRYKEGKRISAGAEKWLDLERWDDTKSCIQVLKSRGYRIAVTHIADDTVSIHDIDWTIPTAIVVGNENRGISEEAIALSDVRCSIPMAGMVESFNVSVAAGILMHHVVRDRISRIGCHGDLSEEERCVVRALFYMRHRDDTETILKELITRQSTTNQGPEVHN